MLSQEPRLRVRGNVPQTQGWAGKQNPRAQEADPQWSGDSGHTLKASDPWGGAGMTLQLLPRNMDEADEGGACEEVELANTPVGMIPQQHLQLRWGAWAGKLTTTTPCSLWQGGETEE